MKNIRRAISLVLAISLVVCLFTIVTPFASAKVLNATKEFKFSSLAETADLQDELINRAKVMHSDATVTLNTDKTVTLTKGNTACAGIALESTATEEIQEISGSIYLPKCLRQSGNGFIFSKTVGSSGDISYQATSYCVGVDPIGGFHLAKDRGSVHINADGTAHSGVNNNGGTWGNNATVYIAKKSVKTETTTKTYVQCTPATNYSTSTEYYTKDEADVFTKHAKNTIGSEAFNANKTSYYKYSSVTKNEFNLANPPADCTDEKTKDGLNYIFKTIKTEEGFFTETGAKGVSLTELGVNDETITALQNVNSITEAERMANFTLKYSGEALKPVLVLSFNVSGVEIATKETSIPFYANSLGKEKALGLAVINSWARNDSYKNLTFGDFTAKYIVNKDERTLDLDNDVRYIGRHYVKNNAHTLGWEQSGFEFSFYGTGATITLSNIKSSTSSGSDRAYLNGYVDGVRQDYVTPDYEPTDDLFINGADPHTFVLAKDLEEGQHTIKVIKRSGSMYNSVTIDNIYIHQSENAQILEKPTAPERKIAVFGDSISEGMGILNGSGLPMNEDPTLSYASLAADAFGAEVSDAVAEGGIGVTVCGKGYTIGEVLDYVDYHNLGTEAENALYSFDSNPDAVVLNIGTNDGSYWNHTTNPIVPSEFVAGLKSLIKKIRAKYPEKPIFYVYGMMAIGDYAKSSIELALAELQTEGVTDIYFIPVSCTTANGEISYAYHPNALGHSRVSKHLIAKMAEVLGWDTADMQNNLTIDAIPEQIYDGTPKTPELTVKLNGQTLTKGTDYLVSYEYNNRVGPAMAKVTLYGDYSGYICRSFNIKCNHEGTVLTETTPAGCGTPGLKTGTCPTCNNPVSEDILPTGNHIWNTEKTEDVPAKCNEPGSKSTHCSVCDASDPTTVEPIPATEQHQYSPRAGMPATFNQDGYLDCLCDLCEEDRVIKTIYAVKTYKLSSSSLEYNGKVRTPSVVVKDSKGKTLKKDVDYTVTMPRGRKTVGKYAVKITLKGNYTGSKTLNFTINPPKCGLSKLTAGKKKLTATWKTQKSQTTGYQLLVSSSSKFKSYRKVTVKSYKTTKTTVSKLSSKKYYYVKMRTYKKVGSTTYYSGWSSVKKVRVK